MIKKLSTTLSVICMLCTSILPGQITKNGGDSNADITTNIVQGSTLGSAIRVGYTISDDSSTVRTHMSKMDANENPVWQRNYRGFTDGTINAYNQFHDLIGTSDRDYIVTGELGTLSERHLFVAKFSDDGDLIWSTEYDKETSSAGMEVIEQGFGIDKKYIVIGYEEVPGRGKEVLVLVFNPDGDLISGRQIGTLNDDVGHGIDTHKNPPITDYSICGTTNQSGNNDVFYLNLSDVTNTKTFVFDGGGDDEAVGLYVQPSLGSEDVLMGVNTTSFGAGDYNMAQINVKSENNFSNTTSNAYLSPEEEKMFNFTLNDICGYYRDTVSGLRHGIHLNKDVLGRNVGSRRIFSCCFEELVYDATDLSNGSFALAGAVTERSQTKFDFMAFRYDRRFPEEAESNCVTYSYDQQPVGVNFSIDSNVTFQNIEFNSSSFFVKNTHVMSNSGTGFSEICGKIDLGNCVCLSDQIVTTTDTITCELPLSLPHTLKNVSFTVDGTYIGTSDSIHINSFGTILLVAQGDKCQISDTIMVNPDLPISSSKRFNQWVFGYGAGLDFNFDNPKHFGSQNSSREGNSSIADKNGNLVLYSDGRTVYNSNHQTILNGTGLLGGNSSTHSCLFIPHPANENLYYLFTTDHGESSNDIKPFMYNLIDISANGGNGEVLEKNILLLDQMNEKLAACQAPDGSFWVVGHKGSYAGENNDFYIFKIDKNGLDTIPSKQSIGNSYGPLNDAGQIKFSPNGKYLAAVVGNSTVDLFSFNWKTGKLSKHIDTELKLGSNYGVEFSPSSKYLYAGSNDRAEIARIDISSRDETIIRASKETFSTLRVPLGFQLAPNGWIYFVKGNSDDILGVITNPDASTDDLRINESGVRLLFGSVEFSLPSSVSSFYAPYPELELDLSNGCVNDSIEFCFTSGTTDNIIWDFGDGVIDTSIAVVNYSYSSTGSYQLNVKTENGCGRSLDTLVIISLSELKEDSNQLKICAEEIIVNSLYPNKGNIWINESGSIVQKGNSITTSNSEVLYEKIIFETCADTLIHDIQVLPPIDYPKEQEFFNCFENLSEFSIELESDNLDSLYWMNFDSKAPIQLVSQVGDYPIVLFSGDICRDTVLVKVINQCEGIVHVPNAFTPNGDNINDQFVPFTKFLTSYKITIFNQWGEVVFLSEDENVHWDGTYRGVIVPDTYSYKLDYFYMVNGEEIKDTQTGFLNLIK